MIATWFIILVSAVLFYNFYWKRRNLPPGPHPLPILGNMLQLYKMHGPDLFLHLQQKYGDVITVWFGPTPVVMVSDAELIRKSLTGKTAEILAGRPLSTEFNNYIRGGNYGIIFTDGDLWREQRRFLLKVFHDYGLGKQLMQERVIDEVVILLDDVKKSINEEGNNIIKINELIDFAIGNVINGFVFGNRIDHKTFDFLKQTLIHMFELFVHPVVKFADFSSVRLVRQVPGGAKLIDEVFDLNKRLYDYFDIGIKEHLASIDFSSDEEPRDYIEAFLRQRHRLESSGDFSHTFCDLQLKSVIFDAWVAGQETTSTTLCWIVLYLMHDMEVQKKLQKEFDREIGSDRFITLDDKSRLHYLQAVIHEGQRLCNLVPLNVPHRVKEDVEIGDYTIPKDTVVFPQITNVLYNEDLFPNARKFDPERFIDSAGKFVPDPNNMPFSLGKRECAGEPLAKLELFIVTANLFNQLRIEIDPNNPPDMTRILGATMQPKPYVSKITLRH